MSEKWDNQAAKVVEILDNIVSDKLTSEVDAERISQTFELNLLDQADIIQDAVRQTFDLWEGGLWDYV